MSNKINSFYNIFYDAFEIQAIVRSIKDFKVLALVPFGSIKSELEYSVFFEYKGYMFYKNIPLHDADFAPCKHSISYYAKWISDDLGREIVKIDEVFFSNKDLEVYLDEINGELFHYFLLYVMNVASFSKFKFTNNSILRSEEFLEYFKEEWEKGLSSVDIFFNSLAKFGISRNTIIEYSKKLDLKIFL